MRLGPRVLLPMLGLALAAAPIVGPARAEIAGPPKVVDGDTIEVQGAARGTMRVPRVPDGGQASPKSSLGSR